MEPAKEKKPAETTVSESVKKRVVQQRKRAPKTYRVRITHNKPVMGAHGKYIQPGEIGKFPFNLVEVLIKRGHGERIKSGTSAARKRE